MKPLDGRRAVVTGGAGGIGRATSLALADAGAEVIVADLASDGAATTSSEIAQRGGAARGLACDVTDEASVEKLFDGAGSLDMLVNTAGVAFGGDAVATPTADWDRTLDVNVRGTWLCSRAFIARALERERPDDRDLVIVNTSSTNAFLAETDSAAYTASKGAVSALTRSMALDFARRGVRVNCVCPGIIATPLTARAFEASEDPDRLRLHWDSLHAIGRIGTPEDIAGVIVFLATDEARFIIGAEIVVDGGLSIGIPLDPP
ncbi:MAG TPA: SDR family oxidoreductase [Solirubrobacteraceae bacterium]|nr:SDR family oxidoreductase [Solirubrobacteraceae bacterium]